MNLVFFYEFNINSLSIREYGMNSRFISRINYEFTIFFANSLSISLKYISVSRIHYEFSIFFLQIHYKFTIDSRICYKFTIYFANSLLIHFIFREFTINSRIR